MMTAAPDLASKMDDLRRLFVDRCAQDAADLDAFPPAAANALDDASEKLRKTAHRLAGAASVFGYAALSLAAQELEDRLGSPAQRSDPGTLEARDRVTAELAALRQDNPA